MIDPDPPAFFQYGVGSGDGDGEGDALGDGLGRGVGTTRTAVPFHFQVIFPIATQMLLRPAGGDPLSFGL